MKALLIIGVLTISGCMSSKTFDKRHTSFPPAPLYSEVTFEDIDLNEDGNITEAEVKNFSNIASSESVGPNISPAIWATIGIVVLTLIMCIISAIIKCNKSE